MKTVEGKTAASPSASTRSCKRKSNIKSSRKKGGDNNIVSVNLTSYTNIIQVMDTVMPPRSGTVDDSLANNADLTSTDAVIIAPTNLIADKAQEDTNMSNIDDNTNLLTDNANSASTEKAPEDVMDTESMSKIEESTKVSKPGKKAAKNTHGTKKAKTHKGGDTKKQSPN